MGTVNGELIREHMRLMQQYGLDHPRTQEIGAAIDESQENCPHGTLVRRIAPVAMDAIGVKNGEMFRLCLLCSKGMPLAKPQ